MILIFFVLAGYGGIGSTAKDHNEIEVDMLSKAFPTTAMKEDDVFFFLFGETNDIVGNCFNV